MRQEDRKAAVRDYKERVAPAGIYVVRCAASGEAWVGRAKDLDTVPNRLWFTLRHGGNPHRALQAAWDAHGEASFTMEPLERLDDDLSPGTRDLLLRKRLKYWAEALGAQPI
jgi:hypothetical protein